MQKYLLLNLTFFHDCTFILDYKDNGKKADDILDIMLRCHIFFHLQNIFKNFQGEIQGDESQLPECS